VARSRSGATCYQAEATGGRAAGEGVAAPSGGNRAPLEADLDMAGRTAGVVRVALGISSWNGGRMSCGGVLDPCAERGGCSLC